MEFLLIRHAESIANTEGIYQGWTYDTDLSTKGKKQARAVTKALGQYSIDKLYASPLKRTWQTAEEICQGLLLGEPTAEDRIKEINHGEWEGLSTQQIEEQYPDMYQQWKSDPENVSFPGGETVSDVKNRAFEFLKEIGNQDYRRVAVVTHDAVIRVILTQVLRREMKDLWIYELDAAGYSIIEWHSKLPKVIKINENEHLNSLASDLSQHAL